MLVYFLYNPFCLHGVHGLLTQFIYFNHCFMSYTVLFDQFVFSILFSDVYERGMCSVDK